MAVVVRKTLKHHVLPVINTKLVENIGIKLYTNIGAINIFSCYFAGGAAGRDNTRKTSFSSDIVKLTTISDKFILGGDLNCRHQHWGCLRSNCWGNILHSQLETRDIYLKYPPDPTYIPTSSRSQPSTLDFFLTNIPQKLTPAEVLNDLGSDHMPVKSILKCSYDKLEANYVYLFSNGNWHMYSNRIKSILRNQSYTISTDPGVIDGMITTLNHAITNATEVSIPKKELKPHTKQLPQYIKNIISIRNLYRRNWIRYRNFYDKIQMNRLNKFISNEISRYRNKSWNKHLSSLKKSSLPFWNITKVLRKKPRLIPTLVNNDTIYTSCKDKCDVLAENFKSNHLCSANLSDTETIQQVSSSVGSLQNAVEVTEHNYLISESYLKGIIKHLKNKKAPGIDRINNTCIKKLPNIGVKLLLTIINSCLSAKYFPNCWKEAKIIPIAKPNKPHNSPKSYRPISLLPSISKILEKVIKDKLLAYIEENNILPPQQFGFRKGHNTSHAVSRIKNIVRTKFEEGKSTGMVLLDIKAAFDSVWHDALIFKMINFKFPIPLIKIINCFLKDRIYRVHIGSCSSNRTSVPAGCPQGSCLSPVLYNIYTADFPILTECTTSIFADDTAVLCSETLAEDIISNLEHSVNSINNYFIKWKISTNSSKTQAIFFTRKRKECFTPQRSLTIGSEIIQWESKVKYLGILLDTKLNFKDHLSFTVDKINKTTRVLYPFINRKSKLSCENKMIILKVIFHSIMFYGAPVWAKCAQCHINKLQVSQNKLLKMIFNLPWFYSTRRLHELSGMDTINHKLHKLKLNFDRRCQDSDYEHIQNILTTSPT